MKYVRRPALMALPVVAALSAAIPAGAAPSSGATALRLESYVSNQSSIGLGVINKLDGSYTHGNYDAILPAGRRTDTYLGWNKADGFYSGAGYCSDVSYWNGSRWVLKGTWLPGLHRLTDDIGQDIKRWEIRAYRC
ncbi:hypothetical protein [Nonomuraea fuscirosea]|uniref:hypothetical protein n=1 Tax=Nonomuraea fuscirosea TaxID=1291556 RepID=UPI0033E921F1